MFENLKNIFNGASRLASLKGETDAAIDLAEVIYEGLKTGKGVHIETAITAAASLGGFALLRSTGINFSGINPGEPVLVQGLDEKGKEVLAAMSGTCTIHNINPETGWTNEVPEQNTSQKSSLELIAQFERPFRLICENKGLAIDKWASVAGICAAKMIKQGERVLDPEIGKAIALKALVFSSKSAPPRDIGEA